MHISISLGEPSHKRKTDLFVHSIQIDSGYYIPINPKTLTDVKLIIKEDKPDLVNLSEIVSQDVGLSAVILKTINAPQLGFNRQVTDIKKSIMLLGVDFFTQLFQMNFIHKAVPEEWPISLERFWDSSMQLAFLTGIIIEHLKIESKILFEDAYTTGLFIDCGIPIMAQRFNNYQATLKAANTASGSMFTEVEDKDLKSNHAIVGYYVAKSWDLPDIICDLILSHHHEDFLTSNKFSLRHKDLFGILKISENILYQYKYSSPMNEWELIGENLLGHFALSEYDYHDLEQDILERMEIEFGGE